MLEVVDSRLKAHLLTAEPYVTFGAEPVAISRKDSLYLLAYTADADKNEYDREKLLLFLFGEDSKSQRLREALMWLNRSLKAIGIEREILQGQPKLRFAQDMVEVDTLEFSRQAKILLAQDVNEPGFDYLSEAESVLRLYKGHFLNDCYFDSGDMRQWHHARQKELANLYHNILEQRVQFHIRQGALAQAQDSAELWLGSIDPGFVPLHYLIWIGLKRRLYSLVQHYLAQLQQFQDTDPTFFGTDVATWRSLIQNEEDPSLLLLRLPTSAGSSSIAKQNEPNLDRNELVNELVRIFTESHRFAVVGLTGLAGVGKTQFAHDAVDLLRQRERDFATVWVQLTPESDFELILNEALAQLQLQQLMTLHYNLKLKRFRQYVRTFPCLIVIDEATTQHLTDSEYVEVLTGMFDSVKLLLIARNLPEVSYYPFELTGFQTDQVQQFLLQQMPILEKEEAPLFDAEW